MLCVFRAAELAGRALPASFLGARLWAKVAAVTRGFSAEHGTAAGPAPPQSRWHHWLISHALSTQTPAPGALWSLLCCILTNCIYLFTKGRVGDLELAWGVGISPEILPRSKTRQKWGWYLQPRPCVRFSFSTRGGPAGAGTCRDSVFGFKAAAGPQCQHSPAARAHRQSGKYPGGKGR